VGPTQFPVQWLPDALSVGVRRPSREADHSHLVPPLPHMPSWRGAQLEAQGQLYVYSG